MGAPKTLQGVPSDAAKNCDDVFENVQGGVMHDVFEKRALAVSREYHLRLDCPSDT